MLRLSMKVLKVMNELWKQKKSWPNLSNYRCNIAKSIQVGERETQQQEMRCVVSGMRLSKLVQ